MTERSIVRHAMFRPLDSRHRRARSPMKIRVSQTKRGALAFWEEDSRMKYKIALERTPEGYSVSVPGLPGCWSEGATEAEAIAHIRDAISEYLLVRDELVRDADVREVEVV